MPRKQVKKKPLNRVKLTARGKGANYQKDINKRYNAKNPEKKKARNKLTNGVRDGRVKRPKGKEFHHTSYGSKPNGKFMSKAKHHKVKKPTRK